ncbi:MAG: amino acid ABC transporter substrate-binding protein [Hungatella sp.]|nr:amino acid ABC transporter substrate-binding protein [Hungatella sp.]
MKKRYIQMTGVLVLLLLCLGSSTREERIQQQRQAERERQEQCYTLTVLSPVTGELDYIGEPVEWTVLYAQDKINDAGGIHGIPVKIYVEDTGFIPEKAVHSVERLAEDQRIILGPVDSPGTEAIASLVEENHIPNVATYVYEEIRERLAPYGIFYMKDALEGEKDAVRIWKEENPDIQKVVLLALETDHAQAEHARALEQYLPAIGMEAVDIIYMDTDQEEGMDAVVQALNAKAEGYISLVRAEEYGMLLQQLRKRGITEGRRILASFSCFEYDMIEAHRAELSGTYIWNSVNLDYEGEEWQALVEDYKEAHGGTSPASSVVVDMYNSVLAWKQCIEELKLSPTAGNLSKERQMIGEWFYNSPVIEGIQGEYQWIDGRKVVDICLFQFDEEGNAVAVNTQ